MNHTPGKWEPIYMEYSKGLKRICTGVGVKVALSGGTYSTIVCNSILPDTDTAYRKERKEIEGNMKLIAAAPDLLKALQNAVKFIKCSPDLAKEGRRPKGLEKWEQLIESITTKTP